MKSLADEPSGGAIEICTSIACVAKAYKIREKMDVSSNPCDKFDEYACGKLYRTDLHVAPMVSTVQLANFRALKGILQINMSEDREYMRHMSKLYNSCLHDKGYMSRAKTTYRASHFSDEWPSLVGNTWSEKCFNLQDLIVQYSSEGIFPLFKFYIEPNLKNTSENAIFLERPNLQHNDDLKEIALDLGARQDVADQDAHDVLNFEKAIDKITDKSTHGSFEDVHEILTIGTLGDNFKFFGIPQALRKIFAKVNMTLGSTQEIIVSPPSYFDKLRKVYDNLDTTRRNRTLQNLFSFHHALARTNDLTGFMRHAFTKTRVPIGFMSKLRSRIQLSSQTSHIMNNTVKKCVKFVSGVFPLAITRKFIEQMKFRTPTVYVNSMVDNIKEKFKEEIVTATWMEQSTKQAALQKLKTLAKKIGYSKKADDPVYLEELYNGLTMTDKFDENVEVIRQYKFLNELRKLGKPVDKSKWPIGSFSVNAMYRPSHNEIIIPAGILVPPIVSDEYPVSINYGSIGTVISQQVAQAFHPRGMAFDSKGNRTNWWNVEDKKRYDAKMKCMVDQYAQFKNKELGMPQNSILDKKEDVADNGGLKITFRAFKTAIENHGKKTILPGLGQGNDKLFFLSYAQLFCKEVPEPDASIHLQTTHSLPRYRLLASL